MVESVGIAFSYRYTFRYRNVDFEGLIESCLPLFRSSFPFVRLIWRAIFVPSENLECEKRAGDGTSFHSRRVVVVRAVYVVVAGLLRSIIAKENGRE